MGAILAVDAKDVLTFFTVHITSIDSFDEYIFEKAHFFCVLIQV